MTRNNLTQTIIWILLLSVAAFTTAKAQPNVHWTPFSNISNSPQQTSEPKITADSEGNVHVVWSETIDNNSREQTIFYTRWHRGQWTPPTDVLMSPDGGTAWVTAIEVDRQGVVHVAWIGTRQGTTVLYYSRAHAEQATRPQGWSSPRVLAYNVSSSGWAADLLADMMGRLHLVYGDGQSANLFHIISEDQGKSWSEPSQVGNVAEGEDGVSSTMLAEDGSGRLHAVWTARKLPEGWPGIRAFYARSLDGGLSWETPLLVDSIENPLYDTNRGPFFLSVGTRGADEIHLAWAGAPNGGRWHQWSENGGNTWFSNEPVFGDRFGTTGFLDMVQDSAGVLHLFTTFGDEPYPGIPQESIWNEVAGRWDDLQPVSTQNIIDCEDPRAAVALGNEIHLVCVEQSGTVPSDVFHSWRILDAPQLRAQMFSPSPVTVASTPTVTRETARVTTTTPEHPSQETIINASRSGDENVATNPVSPLLAGILSAIFVVLAVIGLQLGWRRGR